MTYTLDDYDPDLDEDRRWTTLCGLAILEFMEPGDYVADLGCATGLMSTLFAASGMLVLGVDRSEQYLERARLRAGPLGAEFVCSDLAAWLGEGDSYHGFFEHVVLGNLVGDVADVVGLLEAVKPLLSPVGALHVTATNAASLHRLHGAVLGMPVQSERGDRYGIKRVYSVDKLAADVQAAGFRVRCVADVGMKPWPNDVIAKLDPEVRGRITRAKPPAGMGAMIYLEASL